MSAERPSKMDPEEFDLETLIGLAEALASKHADGHLTMLRFTSGWKVAIGTPDLDSGIGRDQVLRLTAYPTLRVALVALLIEGRRARF